MEENNTENLKEIMEKMLSAPKDDPFNIWFASLLVFLLASNAPVDSNNMLLEKEVSYLRGKVDTLEKILLTKEK